VFTRASHEEKASKFVDDLTRNVGKLVENRLKSITCGRGRARGGEWFMWFDLPRPMINVCGFFDLVDYGNFGDFFHRKNSIHLSRGKCLQITKRGEYRQTQLISIQSKQYVHSK